MKKRRENKIIALALILQLILSFPEIRRTNAYFNDIETSNENLLVAGFLDFFLNAYEFKSFISLGKTVSKDISIVNNNGLDFQYILKVEEISNEDGLCDALNLQAELNDIERYNGDLMSLVSSASTTLGTWKFNIELPIEENLFKNSEECRFDIVFKGWQTNIDFYGENGFTDEERLNFIITAGQTIVLNEFLPRPNGVAYNFDFGSDSSDMPQGEWVELYNNTTEPVNVANWYTRDATNGAGNKVIITASNTFPATTIISSKSWLVVYMNKPILNNNGDTIRLFDDSDSLVDSYEYKDNDFCEIEPTPDNENSTDLSGECSGVPPNKSYARIPDGIGEWVDPIPTPGTPNEIENTKEIEIKTTIEKVVDTEITDEIVAKEVVVSKYSSLFEFIQTMPDETASDETAVKETLATKPERAIP